MKIHSLLVENITSLRGSHTIDFDKLLEHQSLFCLSGATGSGKSSLLNSIGLALYGKTHKGPLSSSDFVSLGAAYGKIELVFSTSGKKYLASWECRLQKKDGSLIKRPLPRRTLMSQGQVIEEDVENIIGLNFDQFSKTIILGQGEFSKFLFSPYSEKKIILEKLYPGDNLLELNQILKSDLKFFTTQIENINDQLSNYQDIGDIDEKTLKIQLDSFNQKDKLLKQIQESFGQLHYTLKKLEQCKERESSLNKQLTEVQHNLNLTDQKRLYSRIGLNEQKELSKGFYQDYESRYQTLASQLKNYEIAEKVKVQLKELEKSQENSQLKIKTLNLTLQKQKQALNLLEQQLEDHHKEYNQLEKELQSLYGDHYERTLTEQKEKLLITKERLQAHVEKIKQIDHNISKRLAKLNSYEEDEKKIVSTRTEREKLANSLTSDHQMKLHEWARGLLVNSSLDHEHCSVCQNKNISHLQKATNHTELPPSPNQDLKNELQLLRHKEQLIISHREEVKSSLDELNHEKEMLIQNFESPCPLDQIESWYDQELIAFKKAEELLEQLKKKNHIIGREKKQLQETEWAIEKIDQETHFLTKNISQSLELQSSLNDKLSDLNISGHESLKQLNQQFSMLKSQKNYYDRAIDLYNEDTQKFENLFNVLTEKNSQGKKELRHIIEQKNQVISQVTQFIQELQGLLSQEILKDMGGFYFEKLPKLSTLKQDKLSLELTQEILDIITLHKSKIQEALEQNQRSFLDAHAKWELLRYKRAEMKKLKESKKNLILELDKLEHLKEVLGHDEFRTFCLGFLEEQLIFQANHQLQYLCDGRYQIKIKKSSRGHDYYVLDALSWGQERKMHTLSGGEIFMISLCLALSLAELTRGQTDIDFFFIDEGFGHLDSESLDQVLDILLSLETQGKQIGVISHVSSLVERIPTGITLHKSQSGHSQIELCL